MRRGLPVGSLHFDLPEEVYNLLRLIPLRRQDRGSFSGEFSLISPGTKNPGHVKPAQRTHTEEFYEVIPDSFQLPALNRDLRAWERIYNTVRPHQALGYLTPLEFLTKTNPFPRRQSVTNLLDEYMSWQDLLGYNE